MILRLIDQRAPVIPFKSQDFLSTYNSNGMLKNFVDDFDSRLDLVISNIQNDSTAGPYAKSQLKVDLKSHLTRNSPFRKAMQSTVTPVETEISMFNVPLTSKDFNPHQEQ